ncbi:MAG TPA: hypothetical protein VKF63_02205 [Terracidiphilus sp.]|nr:hypothetical protein [Terracidiphilus sp.]
MPLSKLQVDILRLLSSHRSPESFIGGSTPLNRNTLRRSGDIDIFHDREERVTEAALNDARTLEDAGYEVTWLRQLPSIHTAQITLGNESTRLEWVADSDYRFFPAEKDGVFGYVLHPADLAMNKAIAAAGRREVRDIVDLVNTHETVLPLGAIVWAAVDKSPGFTPEGLIAEIRRNARYSAADWKALVTSEPIDPVDILARLRAACDQAEAFVARMPTEKAGLLFLDNGRVVQPDPEHLDRYETHAGQRRGHWPASAEITSAMLERYNQKPSL